MNKNKINYYNNSIKLFIENDEIFSKYKTIFTSNNQFILSNILLSFSYNLNSKNKQDNLLYSLSLCFEILDYFITNNITSTDIYFKLNNIIISKLLSYIYSLHNLNQQKIIIDQIKEYNKLIDYIKVFNNEYKINDNPTLINYIDFTEKTYNQIIKNIFNLIWFYNNNFGTNKFKKISSYFSILYKIYIDCLNDDTIFNFKKYFSYQDIFNLYTTTKEKLLTELNEQNIHFDYFNNIIDFIDKIIISILLSRLSIVSSN